MSTFWNVWITVITLGVMLGCIWLISWTRNKKQSDESNDQTTGHAHDGIEEYDNPLPRWWLYKFYGCILFGAIYLALYPGLGEWWPGLLNWTQVNQWQKEVDKADAEYGPLYAHYALMPLDQVALDPKALKMGQRIFSTNCAVCHSSDAKGNYGFPNLTDNDWLFGDSPEIIESSIANGRRATPETMGVTMPAWEAVIGSTGIDQVAAYVMSLSGETADKTLAEKGQVIFSTNCAGCHGADAKGNQAMGAPNLSDEIWLYGGTPDQIRHSIRVGRAGVMPAHKDTLGSDRVHLVAAYIYSLSKQTAK
jgi:cytochrome c oxidase cbb3-type subunit 3